MDKYCVIVNEADDDLSVDAWWEINQGQNIWSETKEDAEESIKKHEKEWRIYVGLPAKKDSDDK